MQLKSLIGAVLLTASGTSVAGSAPEQNPVTTPDPIIPQDYIETGRYSRTVNEPYLSQ